MKKSYFIILIAALFFASCGGDKTNSGSDDSTKNENNQTDQKVEKKVTPETVNLDKPFTPEELTKLVFSWNEVKEVTITGYCDIFFDEDKIGEKVDFVVNPGDKRDISNPDAMHTKCLMKQEYTEKVTKTTPVTIKGEVNKSFGNGIELKNAELIETGKKVEDKGYVAAGDYKGENISLGDFYKSYFGWLDTEVTVIGYYKSSTKSTTSSGETMRIDLKGKDGKTEVGCRLAEGVEVPETLKDNREGVIIKGTVKGEAFGSVIMEGCTFVNR